MIEIDLDDAVFSGVVAQFQKVANGDMRPALQLMSIIAIQAIDRKFSAQGPGWAKLTPKWEARKAKLGRSGLILSLYGNLKAAIVDPAESRYGIFVMEDSPEASTLTMGTKIKYGATHQWGRGPIPARPFLPTQDELAEPFRVELQAYIKEKLGA